MASRAYSQPSIDAHHWALRQFTAWADSRGIHNPAAWDTFLAALERKYRLALSPIRPKVFIAVRNFLRYHCPDCGHEASSPSAAKRGKNSRHKMQDKNLRIHWRALAPL